MIITVELADDPVVRLIEAGDCERFLVAAPSGLDESPDPLRAAGVGYLSEGFAWIRPEAVMDLASGLDLNHDWRDRFEAMVLYAKTKGWWDDASGSIRAHIEEVSA